MTWKEKQRAIVDKYNRSTATELWDVYGRCSTRKQRAYANCKAEMQARGGRDMRVLSASCHFFTCAFRFENEFPVVREVYCGNAVFHEGDRVRILMETRNGIEERS